MNASSKNFAADELTCSCCGSHGVKQWALDRLQEVRAAACRPLTITSSYRCENHPVEAKKAKAGTHNQGIAFDIAVSTGAQRMEIIKLGIEHGATGIGVAKSFVHLDWRVGLAVAWTY